MDELHRYNVLSERSWTQKGIYYMVQDRGYLGKGGAEGLG